MGETDWSSAGARALFQAWVDGPMAKLALYRRICEASTEDDEVCALLGLAPDPAQRLPNLVLAAVHHRLLAGVDSPLADWYPSVVGARSARPVGPGDDDPWPHFRALALGDPAVAELVATRATQTNEVGRTATIAVALTHLRSRLAADRGVGLVELGTSAGLNLGVDRYRYRYEAEGQPASPVGSAEAVFTGDIDEHPGQGIDDDVLTLRCRLRGDARPSLAERIEPIDHRVGIDLNPLDLNDDDDARWLLACQWPEEVARVDRSRAAIDHARRHGPPPVVRGSIVDLAAEVLGQVPEPLHPVALSSWVMSYLTESERGAVVDSLDELGRRRDLSWIVCEQPELVPGLPLAGRPDGKGDGTATALVLVEWRSGVRSSTRLGDQHPHGTWLEWLAA